MSSSNHVPVHTLILPINFNFKSGQSRWKQMVNSLKKDLGFVGLWFVCFLIEAAFQFGTKAKTPWSGSLLDLSWNVCSGMQDALCRNGGQLLNLLGICWVIARSQLTRYLLVLNKQDNSAGRLTGHALPLVPTLSSFWWAHYNIDLTFIHNPLVMLS